MNAKTIWQLLKETFSEWSEDKASRLAAALAYYATFSMAPLLVIVIALAGLIFGHKSAQEQIVGQLRGLMGEQGAQLVQTMIEKASNPSESVLATVISVITLILGATGVVGELQDALNTIWNVAPKPGVGILGMIRSRFLSFTMVLGLGFLLMVSLILSAALAGIMEYLNGIIPGYAIVLQFLNLVLGFGVALLLFAMIYKALPAVKISWSDVWIGAAITALLFTVGRFLIGFYLGRSATVSAYGAAGSLAIILLWVYYSAQILFLGAEFTQVYARKFGSRIVPEENAVPLSEADRTKQGLVSKEKVRDLAQQQKEAPALTAKGESSLYMPAFLGVLIGYVIATLRGRKSSEKSGERKVAR